MKLDVKVLRYMTNDHFRVLTAIEMGMKNHDLVPVPLIVMISALKHGGVQKILSNLLRDKLITHEHKMYDGYKLTYAGYDYLALRAMVKRGTISSVGQQIGVGKESDIYIVENDDGEQLCLKLHRLGRVSFRAIKSKRDYLKSGQSASWLYMSRLAAIKEFAFMKALHDNGFPTPVPVDQSRHCILMSFAKGIPLYQLRFVPDPTIIRDKMFSMLVDLAEHGLIHGDFNEYNMLIDDDLNLTLIDFPQMVSTSHDNAEEYFDRDAQCVCRFFFKKFNLETPDEIIPRLSDIKNKKVLDVQVHASGYSVEDEKEYLRLMEMTREMEENGDLQAGEEMNEAADMENEEEEDVAVPEGEDDYVIDEQEKKQIEEYKKELEEEIEDDDDEEEEEEEELKKQYQYSGKNVCYICGQEGHKAKKCPTLNENKEESSGKSKKKSKQLYTPSDLAIRNRIRANLDRRTERNKAVTRNQEKNRARRELKDSVKDFL